MNLKTDHKEKADTISNRRQYSRMKGQKLAAKEGLSWQTEII